jgi:predicted permease
MINILLECFLLISLGYALKKIAPLGFDAHTTRQSIISLIYVLLLPVLVIKSLWTSPAELIQWQISFSVTITVLITATLVWLIYRKLTTNTATLGAIILAGSLTNATYQGLPILTDQLGLLGTAIAIQYDFFAQTPLLLTLGILLAKKFGHSTEIPEHWMKTLIKVPALWAALIGLILNQQHIAPIEPLMTWLNHLSSPVVPLMLISIGLGLRLESLHPKDFPFLAPVVIIKLMIAPIIIITIAQYLQLTEEIIIGLALEAGMSSIIIAIVVCDRYHLDSNKYIEVVTLTLLLSLGSLPLWKWLLT